jgi:hypothetical protein
MRHLRAMAAAIPFAAGPIQIAFLLFSVAVFLGAHALARYSPEIYHDISKGDSGGGLLEKVQAGLYLAAFVLGCISTVRAYRTLAFWPLFLFSLGAFFVFGEEVAWGQFLIGVEVPEFFQTHNQQHDLTLHNLNWIEDRHLHYWAFFAIGLYGGIAWLAEPCLPRQWLILIPPWFLTLYFMVCMAYFGHKTMANFPFPHLIAKQEASETFLALGVFFMAVVNLCWSYGYESVRSKDFAASDVQRSLR